MPERVYRTENGNVAGRQIEAQRAGIETTHFARPNLASPLLEMISLNACRTCLKDWFDLLKITSRPTG
jgi:hypothetical protein